MDVTVLRLLAEGAWITLMLTVTAGILGTLISMLVGAALAFEVPVLRVVLRVYVEVFRNTSGLVQLFYAYYVLPLIGLNLDALTAAMLALALNNGSFGADIVRGAIRSVDRTQYEAATALSMGRWLALRRVIFPQAYRIAVPPLTNLAVMLLKATSLASLVAVNELTANVGLGIDATGRIELLYATALGIYFVMALGITRLASMLERRLARGDPGKGRGWASTFNMP
jgi:polar amino acid transport system permease protein